METKQLRRHPLAYRQKAELERERRGRRVPGTDPLNEDGHRHHEVSVEESAVGFPEKVIQQVLSFTQRLGADRKSARHRKEKRHGGLGRTQPGRRGFVERVAAALPANSPNQLAAGHSLGLRRTVDAHAERGLELILREARQRGVGRIERDVLESVHRRRQPGARHPRGARDEEEAELLLHRLQVGVEAPQLRLRFREELLVLPCAEERRVVVVDEENERCVLPRRDPFGQPGDRPARITRDLESGIVRRGRDQGVERRAEVFSRSERSERSEVETKHVVRPVRPKAFDGETLEVPKPVSKERFDRREKQRLPESLRTREEGVEDVRHGPGADKKAGVGRSGVNTSDTLSDAFTTRVFLILQALDRRDEGKKRPRLVQSKTGFPIFWILCGVRLTRSVGAGRIGVNTSVTLPAPSAPQSFKLLIGVKVPSSFGRKTKCSLR